MKQAPITHEHDTEAIRGIPGVLPTSETLIWQGTPTWKGLALRVFHVRKVAIYFAILCIWRALTGVAENEAFGEVVASLSIMLSISAVGMGLLLFLAWAYAKTTVYTLTSERILIRCGLALTLTVNLPLSKLHKADIRLCGDRTGDIALDFMGPYRVSYIYLWPFVRPWRFGRPQPLLRALRDPQAVSDLLLKTVQGQVVRAPIEAEDDVRAEPGLIPTPAPAE